MTTSTIRLNDSEGMEAMMRGYQHGDPLREVFKFTHPDRLSYSDSRATLIQLLEEVFDLGNVLEGDHYRDHRLHSEAVRYRAAGNRSVSVGDVVVIKTPDGFTQIFAASRFGWDRLSITETEKTLSQ